MAPPLGAIPQTTPSLVHDPATNTLSIQALPVPEPSGLDQHLLRVHAVSLTNGELAWPEPSQARPHPIPGYDVAGTVASAPPGSPFPPGTDVYARTGFDRPGSARGFSVALTAEMARRPHGVPAEEAATVPISALTAWQALFVHGGIAAPVAATEGSDGHRAEVVAASRRANAGKRVLITAAAGGVGVWAVQLARLVGVGHVVGSCGPSNAQFVRDRGAHEVVDYTATQDLSSWADRDGGGRFDLVLDCVGGTLLEQCWRCVRDRGTLISIAQPPAPRRPASGVGEDVRGMFFIVEADGAQLELITELIETGKCRAVLDSVYALEEFEAAFDRSRGGHLRGKVVLKIGS